MTKFIQNRGKLHLSRPTRPTWSLCGRAGDLVEVNILPSENNICCYCWRRAEVNLYDDLRQNILEATAPEHHNNNFSLWLRAVKHRFGSLEKYTTLDHQIFEVLAANQWLLLVEPGGVDAVTKPKPWHTSGPECYKRIEKVGPPTFNGGFLDQIIKCSNCDWCDVDTIINPSSEVVAEALTYQPKLF